MSLELSQMTNEKETYKTQGFYDLAVIAIQGDFTEIKAAIKKRIIMLRRARGVDGKGHISAQAYILGNEGILISKA